MVLTVYTKVAYLHRLQTDAILRHNITHHTNGYRMVIRFVLQCSTSDGISLVYVMMVIKIISIVDELV